MNANKKAIALLSVIVLATPLITNGAMFENPLSGGSVTSFEELIKKVLLFFIALVAFISITAIVYGGVLLVVGGIRGEQEIKRGKEIIFWAIIGLLIVGGATSLMAIVRAVLGLGVGIIP